MEREKTFFQSPNTFWCFSYRKMKKTTSRQRMEKEQQRQHHASTNGRKAEADPNDSFGENERKLSTGDGGGVEKKIPVRQMKKFWVFDYN